MLCKRLIRIAALMLALLMLLSALPAMAASNAKLSEVKLAETELNKLVSYYYGSVDVERQGAVVAPEYAADQTKTVTLDDKTGMLTMDFGVAAKVTRVELVSVNGATELGGDDIDVWLGTEKFGKVYFPKTGGNEKRAQLGKLSKQDYSVTTDTVDGHAVLEISFSDNAAGRYLVIEFKDTTSAGNFTLEQIGRDVHVYGQISTVNAPAVKATELTVRPSTLYGDDGSLPLPQVGSEAYTAFDTKDVSLTLDMGQVLAVEKITLRASNEAVQIPTDAVTVCVSDDGEEYRIASGITLTQALVDGRRELYLRADSFLQGRYFKLCYTADGVHAFHIINTEEDILVSYDPFGLPDSDPERREEYAISVSAAYFDSRLKAEYGEDALNKRNELSVEDFVIWYLENCDSNFNYLYRWSNLGESCAADNVNISMALKLPAKGPVDQVVVTSSGASANTRLEPEDWIVSYSVDDRNFTLIDSDSMTFRETTVDGKPAHIIDFPEVEAKTLLVYNKYTKNFEELPSGSGWFVVLTNRSCYAAYNKLGADVRYTASPVAVTGLTNDPAPSRDVNTQLLLELEAEAQILSVQLICRSSAAPATEDYEVLYFADEQWNSAQWTAAAKDGIVTLTLDAPVSTKYVLVRYNGDGEFIDYFAENYSDYSVTVAREGSPVSLAQGMTARGFAPAAGYLPTGLAKTQTEIWALIMAENDPVAGYQVAKENGVSIGWAYRTSDYYALDNGKIRQSLMLYWSEAQMLNRIYIEANQDKDNIRLTADDFYVAYSTDNFVTYETFEPGDLTVIAGETADNGYQCFTVDLPEAVSASHVILYTSYSVGTLVEPAASEAYFIMVPGTSDAFYVPKSETVVPSASTLKSGEVPMKKTDVLLDLGEECSALSVNLFPGTEREFVADDYTLQIWRDGQWKSVELSAADHVFTFAEPVTVRYILLRYTGESKVSDWFDKTFTDITVTLEAKGETTSLKDGMTNAGFAQGAGCITASNGLTAAELWALIAAESDPVSAYQVAKTNGLSIGWAYRTSYNNFALDHGTIRESLMIYWAEAKDLDRIYIESNRTADNIRLTADDFYVAFSTDNFATYETFTPSDLSVTAGETADTGLECFTIDLPETVKASHVMVYTAYSLDLSVPAAGEAYYTVNLNSTDVFRVPRPEAVSPKTTTLTGGEDPFASDEEGKTEEVLSNTVFALDHTGRSVGFENLDGRSIHRITVLGSGETSWDAADYILSVSEDNTIWTQVTDFTLSLEVLAGKAALCVDACLDAKYVKLTYVGQTADDFTVSELDRSVRVFCLEENYDFSDLYKLSAQIGYTDGDRSPTVGAAGSFGSTDPFAFDANYRSLVADLGDVGSINYIRIFDDDGQTRLQKQDLSVYVSDDNVTYKKIDDFDFRQDGAVLHLYNFTAVGRYIKVHQVNYEVNDDDQDADGFDYYATVKGGLQSLMAVYQVPIFTDYREEGAYPYGQGQWQYYKELTLEGTGELVYMSYDQLGLAELVAAGKLQADYSDIRFTTREGLLLHCYDTGEGFYVRAKNNSTVLMFYGEPNAESVCDGTGTFQVDYGTKTFISALGGDVHMAQLEDGRVVQIAHRDFNETGREVYMAISEDNGLNFGEPVRLSYTENNMAQAGGILELPDGTVVVHYIWAEKNGGYGAYMDPEQTNVQVYVITSKDLVNWTEPVHVNTGYTYNLATTNMTVTANGDLYLPVATLVSNEGSAGIAVMRSRDGGQTWENVSGLIVDEHAGFESGYSEPSVVELEEGTIRVYFRQGAGNEINKLGQITSYDNGESWTAVEQSPFYSTCTQPVVHKLESGRILLMWAGHNGTGSDTYQRMPVTLVYSDDNGQSWSGYEELSGRTEINIPFGHPMALQPDFCYTEDGSLTWMIWVRGSIYAPDGAWMGYHVEDFDRWMEENTGAFDDFEQASAVKGNYWYEMGPRVGISGEYSVSGENALRIKDSSTIDTALAARNFMGVKRGEVRFSLNFTSAASGLRLGLWECEPVHVGDYGDMFQIDVSASGELSWVNGAGELVGTGATLELGKWYELNMKFDVEAGTMELLVDGSSVAVASCTQQQNVIAYFAAFSTEVAETGTEFWLDDLIVIDSEDAALALVTVSEEKTDAIVVAQPQISYISLSLKDTVRMNFYTYAAPKIQGDATAYMELTMADGRVEKYKLSDAEKIAHEDGNTYHVFSLGLPAKEMADNVTARLVYGNGEEVTEASTYSILAYAESVLANSTDAKLRKMVVAMLNYGAAAQRQFGYHTDNLVNEGLDCRENDAYTTSGVTASVLEAWRLPAVQGIDGAVTFTGTSLLLKAETTLRYFFTLAEGMSVDDVSFTCNGKALEIQQRDGMLYVDVTGITAKNLDRFYTVTVTCGDTYADVINSPLSYCYNVLTMQDAGDVLVELAKTLYLYNQAANDYFN